jgi:hypothetical protein
MGVIGTRNDRGWNEVRTNKLEDAWVKLTKWIFGSDMMWRVIHRIERRKLRK